MQGKAANGLAAGKRQRGGFTDHNAAWLKPATKQQHASSEDEDEEDEQQVGGTGCFVKAAAALQYQVL